MNKTGYKKYETDPNYVIKRKYIYRISDNSRFCNMSDLEHMSKWYSQHDEHGDVYWCPNCDAMQVG